MTHPHLSETELNDLVDGRVPADDRERIEGHLDGCAFCRSERDELRGVVAFARASRHTSVPPEELWSLVSACTVHERVVRRQLVRSARPALAGVMLAVALLSAVGGAWAVQRVGPPTARRSLAALGWLGQRPDAAPTADPAARAQLAELDERIRQAVAATTARPDDPDALRALADLYARRRALLGVAR